MTSLWRYMPHASGKAPRTSKNAMPFVQASKALSRRPCASVICVRHATSDYQKRSSSMSLRLQRSMSDESVLLSTELWVYTSRGLKRVEMGSGGGGIRTHEGG